MSIGLSSCWPVLVGLLGFLLAVEHGPAVPDKASTTAKRGITAHGSAATGNDLGRFVVTDALIDPVLDNYQQRYFAHDPRYVGRLVVVEPKRLFIDSGDPCTQISRRWTRRTLASFLRANNHRRNEAANRAPRVADWRLNPAPSGPILMVEYSCDTPHTAEALTPGRQWSGVTGWALGNGRRALMYDGEVILILQPVTMVTPNPSFSCTKASTVTERAICADPSLANWDRSVYAAYKLLLNGRENSDEWSPVDDPDVLKESQVKWRRERDRCGANRECLLGKMYTRTDALMRRQY